MSMDETRAGSSGLLIAQPLSGVRVLDLSRFPPGAYCTVLLGDLGAEVCRVDAPGADLTRAGIGVGLGRGRRSAAIDLRHPQGPEVLRRVAGWADVLVENNRPGDMEARGYGYRQISAEHPRLVWCSITGFGQDGPYARYPGHDLTYTAQSGLLAAINPELPWHPQQVLALPIGAMLAASAITAALFDRERTGRGRWIDISLTEAATWLLTGSDRSLAEGSWIPVSASPPVPLCRRPLRHGRRAGTEDLGGVVRGPRPSRARARGPTGGGAFGRAGGAAGIGVRYETCGGVADLAGAEGCRDQHRQPRC